MGDEDVWRRKIQTIAVDIFEAVAGRDRSVDIEEVERWLNGDEHRYNNAHHSLASKEGHWFAEVKEYRAAQQLEAARPQRAPTSVVTFAEGKHATAAAAAAGSGAREASVERALPPGVFMSAKLRARRAATPRTVFARRRASKLTLAAERAAEAAGLEAGESAEAGGHERHQGPRHAVQSSVHGSPQAVAQARSGGAISCLKPQRKNAAEYAHEAALTAKSAREEAAQQQERTSKRQARGKRPREEAKATEARARKRPARGAERGGSGGGGAGGTSIL